MSIAAWFERATNPLTGLDADQQFEKLQWGRRPDRTFSVPAPHVPGGQDVAQLGWLRALFFADGTIWKFGRPYPLLVVGEVDNRLYFVGGNTNAMARAGQWGRPGSRRETVRIDYVSRKGRRRGRTYYYHDHDAGNAVLIVRADGLPRYEGPYSVRPEGIVG